MNLIKSLIYLIKILFIKEKIPKVKEVPRKEKKFEGAVLKSPIWVLHMFLPKSYQLSS